MSRKDHYPSSVYCKDDLKKCIFFEILLGVLVFHRPVVLAVMP